MPQRELERIAAVNRFLKLEISREKELYDILQLAAAICGTSVALVTFIDENEQHIKVRFGTNLETTSREDAFCSYNLEHPHMMVVTDAQTDERFINNPLVTGEPGIRFYAGAPLTTRDGYVLGNLCVLDNTPKVPRQDQLDVLEILSRQVITILELEASVQILKQQFIEAKGAEIKLRSFFESSGTCHWLIGRELEVLAFNKPLADFIYKIFQVHLQTGMKAPEFINKSYLDEFLLNYNRALQGETIQLERYLQYEKESIWWHITFSPACTPDGAIIGVSYNAVDITKAKQQETKVMEQNKSLREIAFIQSHELRKPVSTILSFMHLFRLQNYQVTKEDLVLMETVVTDLDNKIKEIVQHTVQ